MTHDEDQRMQERLRAAFDQVHMPAGLAERTMARIEAERAREQGLDATPQDKNPAPLGEAAQSKVSDRPYGAMRAETPGSPRAERKAGASPTDAARRPEATGTSGGVAGAARAEQRLRARRPLRRRALIAALAACLAIVAAGIGGFAWASQPCAYVSIDVNPSIELGINRFDRVATAEAYNDDGARLLEAVPVEGMGYEDALTALETGLRGYLSDGATIEVTIVCDDEARTEALESACTRCLDSTGTGRVHCSSASIEEHHEAHDAGMGLGKYRLYQELVARGVDISHDEAEHMTMRELRELAEREGITDVADQSSTQGSNSRAGAGSPHDADERAHHRRRGHDD